MARVGRPGRFANSGVDADFLKDVNRILAAWGLLGYENRARGLYINSNGVLKVELAALIGPMLEDWLWIRHKLKYWEVQGFLNTGDVEGLAKVFVWRYYFWVGCELRDHGDEYEYRHVPTEAEKAALRQKRRRIVGRRASRPDNGDAVEEE